MWPVKMELYLFISVGHAAYIATHSCTCFIYFHWSWLMTPMEQHGCILAQFLRRLTRKKKILHRLPPSYCLCLLFVFAWYTLVLEIGVVLFLQDPRLDLEGIIVCAPPNSGKIVTRHVGRLPRWGSVQLQYPLNLYSVTVQLDLWTWHLGDSKHK